MKTRILQIRIVFCWAHKTGEWRHEVCDAIKIKTHGRPAVSLFRYGLDFIVDAITNIARGANFFRKCLARIRLPVPNFHAEEWCI